MPQPGLSPYQTGYPVETDRTRLIGGAADITLKAYHIGDTNRMFGKASVAIEGGYWTIEPVITWADCESGWYYYEDEADGTNIPDDYDPNEWRSFGAGYGYLHNIQICWKLEIVTYEAGKSPKHTFLFTDILTAAWSDLYAAYAFGSLSETTGEWTIRTKFGCVETVTVAEEADWDNFPENARQEGMRLTSALFDDEAEAAYATGTLIVNGSSYTFEPTFAAAPMSAQANVLIEKQYPTIWYPNQDVPWRGTYGTIQVYWPAGSAASSYPARLVGSCELGTTEGKFHTGDSALKLWAKWDGTYTPSDAGTYECYAQVSGAEVSFYCCNYVNVPDEGFAYLEWVSPPYSYQFVGEVVYMGDADASGITPEFRNISSPYVGEELTWEGTTSPIYTGGGNWSLTGESELGGPLMPNPPWDAYADNDGNPTDEYEDAYLDGTYGYYGVDETSIQAWNPPYFALELTNPLDFGGYADQTRVMILHPRAKDVLTIAVNETVAVDDFSELYPAVAEGWRGTLCTVAAEPGGGIRVSDVQAGAYIYREFDYDADNHVWMPGHRYMKVDFEAFDAETEAPVETTVGIRFIGVGDEDLWQRTYTHLLRDEYFDLCRPDDLSTPNPDLNQSVLDQMQPFNTADFGGVLSDLSWSFGPGWVSALHIRGLTEGVEYVMNEVQSIQLRLDKESPGNALADDAISNALVAREYDGERLVGRKWNSPDHDKYYVNRILAFTVNGRTSFESGSVRRDLEYIAAELWDTQDNLSILGISNGGNQWPADQFSGLTITDLIPYDSDWWDAGEGRWTDERVLFCPETTPAFWLVDGIESGASITLSARPLYDWITAGVWYGDGNDTAVDVMTFRFKLIVGGNRIHGILWEGDETAEEVEEDEDFDFSLDNPAVNDETSELGTLVTAYQLEPSSTMTWETQEQEITISRANVWNRIAWYIAAAEEEGVAGPLAICHSKMTGRTYLVHDGTAAKLVIWDFEASTPTVRSAPMTTDSGYGISAVGDRAESVRVVYDSSGTIYRQDTTDEGITWGSAVSICAGAFPQLSYNMDDNVELLGYINAGYACVRRKLGDGSYGSEIQVAAVADGDLATIVQRPGSRDGAAVMVIKAAADGSLTRYLSTDSGKAWAVDE